MIASAAGAICCSRGLLAIALQDRTRTNVNASLEHVNR